MCMKFSDLKFCVQKNTFATEKSLKFCSVYKVYTRGFSPKIRSCSIRFAREFGAFGVFGGVPNGLFRRFAPNSARFLSSKRRKKKTKAVMDKIRAKVPNNKVKTRS